MLSHDMLVQLFMAHCSEVALEISFLLRLYQVGYSQWWPLLARIWFVKHCQIASNRAPSFASNSAPWSRRHGTSPHFWSKFHANFRVAGSAIPYNQAALAQVYPGGKAEYLRQFQAALDKSIQSGFILATDRNEILALARRGYPQNAPQ
jgi:Alpha/beta hydrolase domain